MKDFFQKNFTEYTEKLSEQKDLSLQKLQDYKKQYTQYFDEQIEKATSRLDLIAQAAKESASLRKFKISVPQTLLPFKLRMLISVPFIYGMIIPAIILHIGIEIYHQVAFRLYSIPRVPIKHYFIFDRHHLSYLNWFEKFNCLYCAYFNGLMGYSCEIAGRTERFFCPIKHARKAKNQHTQYEHFVEYLEGENYRKNRDELRKFKEVKPEK